ncbi:MAG: hypothetical protein Q7J34_03360 [Bacteroidales bacterium]|nr:hypothetical protein [Bacteroidales bacterium]
MNPARIFIALMLFLMAGGLLHAQSQPCNTVFRDTLFICAGSLMEIDGKQIRYSEDTLFPIQAGTQWRILNDPYKVSTIFYDSLRKFAHKTGTGKLMYNLLVPGEKDAITDVQADLLTTEGARKFRKYSGKKIRKIRLRQFSVFGSDLYDPKAISTSWLGRFGNSIHSNTHPSVISRNLIVSEGDIINALELAENEQFLRGLGYFDDVHLELIPVKDDSQEVDLLIFVKDNFSLGIDIGVRTISHWNLGIFDKNFLGRGHRLEMYFSANASASPFFSVASAAYLIPNIMGTFFDARLGVVNELAYSSLSAGLSREFYIYSLKYAGGVEFSHHEQLKNFYFPALYTEKIVYNAQQVWLGRSALLISGEKPTSLAFSGSVSNRLYTRRPYSSPDSNLLFYNSSQVLFSLSVSRNLYYTGNYIYQFGRTEDIPYGYIFEVTAGPDGYEFYDRFYTGLSFGWGHYYPLTGYLSSRFSISGYQKQGEFEQGLINYKFNYFSNLVKSGFFKLRFFASLSYVNGLSRLHGESVNVVRELGLSGLDSDDTLHFAGSKKVCLSFNTNIYTPFYFYGFKVAFFNFANLAWIGASDVPAYDNKFYSGFGFGVNIRNEKLVIKTLQFRIAFYPGLPEKKGAIQFEFSGINLLQFFNFKPRAPRVMAYE